MKNITLLLSLCIFLLAACAPAVTATPTPAPTAIPALNSSMATPAVGWVVVNERPGAKSAFVFAEPKPDAGKLGEEPIGAQGDLLGFDPTGEWALARFDDLTGWMPVAVLIVTSDY